MTEQSQNNWYVVTGAPCSGKTKLLTALAQEGFSIVPETARVLIDQGLAKGRTIEEIRSDERAFQDQVLEMKYAVEAELPPDQKLILDRGIPDTLAYHELYGFVLNETEIQRIHSAKYKKVFLLDPIEYKKDYARVETKEEQLKLDQLLEKAYRECGAEIIRLPVVTLGERLVLIKEYLK